MRILHQHGRVTDITSGNLLSEGRPPHVESRPEPFPDAAFIETVLNARRNMDDWQEQYGTARTANNLAAVRICTGDLEAALAAYQEAESKLIDMLQEGNPHPKPLTFAGLAMVKYNAAVLFWAAGDLTTTGRSRTTTGWVHTRRS